MDRKNKNAAKVQRLKDEYQELVNEDNSWNKKSSYKKPIKRRASKAARRGEKYIIEEEEYEEI